MCGSWGNSDLHQVALSYHRAGLAAACLMKIARVCYLIIMWTSGKEHLQGTMSRVILEIESGCLETSPDKAR